MWTHMLMNLQTLRHRRETLGWRAAAGGTFCCFDWHSFTHTHTHTHTHTGGLSETGSTLIAVVYWAADSQPLRFFRNIHVMRPRESRSDLTHITHWDERGPAGPVVAVEGRRGRTRTVGRSVAVSRGAAF